MGRVDDDHSLTRTYSLDALEGMGPMPTPSPRRFPRRYVDLGFLGSGSMGEVRKVRDVKLGITVAMKVLRVEALDLAAVRARFQGEARLTARLRHPSIVAVHDTGILDGGRVWFTMELVEGTRLDHLIDALHASIGPNTWRATREGWTLRRAVRAFVQVCEAVGYAHAQGVIHRDLKPQNILYGGHGAVKVMDWGIACGTDFDLVEDLESVEALPSGHRTVLGRVVGTPAYMPPEQAEGRTAALAPAADVYALGAILYHMLTGAPPYEGEPEDIIDVVRRGPPPPVRERFEGTAPLPAGLVALVEQAMSREPALRPRDAHTLAHRIRRWLRADARRAEALELVEQARAQRVRMARIQEEVDALAVTAEAALRTLPVSAPLSARKPAWQLEQMAEEKAVDVEQLRAESEERLWAALELVPDLPEARELLAEAQRDALLAAEAASDPLEVAHREAVLWELDDGRHQAFLEGRAHVSLQTDPPGAEVVLHRYVERDRALVPQAERVLGITPLERVPVQAGRWLLELRHPEREVVRYPIHLRREDHWDGIPPGGDAPVAVWLPGPGEIRDDEIYVPPGWCWIGDRGLRDAARPARVWCDGFVMTRWPLTAGDLHALVAHAHAQGDPAFERDRHLSVLLAMPAARVQDGVLNIDGHVEPRWPVRLKDLPQVGVFLSWREAETGHRWRLPTVVEVEKAGRGVDGRIYPWGDRFDPALSHGADSMEFLRPVPVGSYPSDRSIYGLVDAKAYGPVLTCTSASAPALRSGDRAPAGTYGLPDVDVLMSGSHPVDNPARNSLARLDRYQVARGHRAIHVRLVRGLGDP